MKELNKKNATLNQNMHEKELKIEELTKKLNSSICKHKMIFKAPQNSKYWIRLREGESLYIEYN